MNAQFRQLESTAKYVEELKGTADRNEIANRFKNQISSNKNKFGNRFVMKKNCNKCLYCHDNF